MIEQRLQDLGLELPPPPKPLGRYVPARLAGGLLFLSGMLPIADGKLAARGRLGVNVSVSDGQRAAALAVKNALAVARDHLGDLNRIDGVVRLGVTVATSENFEQHTAVADGASDLLADIFGEKSGHTRLASGVQSLPLGAPVVLEIIFAVSDK